MPFTPNFFQSQDNTEELKSILGALIKYRRIEESMSLSFVADILHINKGYLSEAENGKRFLAKKHIQTLFDFLGSSFVDSPAILYQLRASLDQIFELSIDFHYEKIQELCIDILKERVTYESSYGFFTFHLIELIYEILIHHDHETIEKIESLFSAYAGILTTTEKTYLFYFLAEYYIRQSDFQKGEGYIQQAYSLLKTGMHPKIFALLQALEATSLCHQGQSGKAFLQITKSLNYFKNTLYFKRIVFIHYITGICLLGMRLFEEAKQHFTNLLPNFPDPDSVMAQSILAHLSWCYLLIQEYEKALTYANMAFEHGADSIELDVCQAFSFFSLKQYEACLAVVERCANEKQKSYLFDFLQLIQYKIEHSEPDFLQTANAVLAQAEKKKNKEIEKMTLGLIVNFYEESHQLDQSHLHLKQLTQLLAA